MAYWTLMLLMCALFWWMNVLTPLKEDDMLHSLVIGDLTHVNSWGDLLHSYRNKFFITNGRTGDMLAELFCGLLGKPVFNVLNTLIFGLLAHVVSLLSTGRRSILSLSMLLACIGTCYPVPGETMLWIAGSCNYLWSITATLWLLYYLLHHKHGQRAGRLAYLLLVPWAVMAGAANEAMSLPFLAAMLLYCGVNRRAIDRQVVCVLVAYALGVSLIMASPAAWERASGGGIAVDMPLVDLLYSRLHILGEKMLRFVVPVVACLIGAIVLFKEGVKPFKASVWPYVMLMSALFMLVLGWYPERPYAPLVTVSLIVVILAADVVLRRWWPLRAAVIVFCLALGIYTHVRALPVLQQYKAVNERVVEEIRSAPGQAILRESPFKGYSRFLFTLPMKSDYFFTNEYIWRAYFDKENVQFVSDSVYVRLHDGRLLDGAIAMPFKADRPALYGGLVAFPDQDYMLLTLKLDSLPTAYQMGKAFWNDGGDALSSSEKAYRHQYAIETASDPIGYYPLRYAGQVMMVLPLMGDKISRVELLLDYAGDDRIMLYREGPNPAQVKKPKQSK